MASPSSSARPVPRLYLAAHAGTEVASLAETLAGLLPSADVAAVLMRFAPADDRTLISRIKALAPAIQNAGAAFILDSHSELVARGGADGAHLIGLAALTAALPELRPERIAGAGGLHTRHDAMVASESGADYVLFGEPDETGQRPAVDAIAERIGWWAELFEPPCVAYAATLAELHTFAAAGADFLLLDEAVWNDPRGPRAALAEASGIIAGMTHAS
ncbi:MAG: thiamine phosphate synthase [Xanthobacteraceae bacterium]|nr:MAG: thiamine phosphate synthase [Xanthobacteraceae bacterium]